jgi:hypothetical protein
VDGPSTRQGTRFVGSCSQHSGPEQTHWGRQDSHQRNRWWIPGPGLPGTPKRVGDGDYRRGRPRLERLSLLAEPVGSCGGVQGRRRQHGKRNGVCVAAASLQLSFRLPNTRPGGNRILEMDRSFVGGVVVGVGGVQCWQRCGWHPGSRILGSGGTSITKIPANNYNNENNNNSSSYARTKQKNNFVPSCVFWSDLAISLTNEI